MTPQRRIEVNLNNSCLAIIAAYVVVAAMLPAPPWSWQVTVPALLAVYVLVALNTPSRDNRLQLWHGHYTWGLLLTSSVSDRDDDDSPSVSHLSLHLLGWSLTLPVPVLFPAYREKRFPNWPPETVTTVGRNWYYIAHSRTFGVRQLDGHLSLMYGRQTHSSDTTRQWGMFMPWRVWSRVRKAAYPCGNPRTPEFLIADNDYDWRARLPVGFQLHFQFTDYDGRCITGCGIHTITIYQRGRGLWAWLLTPTPLRIDDVMELNFDQEVGPEKGSWKGGMIGCSAPVNPGECLGDAILSAVTSHTRRACRDFRVIGVA